MVTFRLILALATQYGWDVDHMDVVTAFLNPRIDRDNIYRKCHWESIGLHRVEACQAEVH